MIPAAEEERLNKILSRSTEKELWLGNDADDMRAPGRHIDPRAMIGDYTSDPVQYSLDRIELVENTLPGLIEKYSDPGRSYEELRDAYLVLIYTYANNLDVISRQIGGVYVDRSMTGQEGADVPFKPVAYDYQKRAMGALTQYAFSPTAYSAPSQVYQYLLRQRRGFDITTRMRISRSTIEYWACRSDIWIICFTRTFSSGFLIRSCMAMSTIWPNLLPN